MGGAVYEARRSGGILNENLVLTVLGAMVLVMVALTFVAFRRPRRLGNLGVAQTGQNPPKEVSVRLDDDIEAIWTPPEVHEHRPVTWIRPFAPIIFLVLHLGQCFICALVYDVAECSGNPMDVGRIFICLMALNLSVLAVKYSGPSLTLIMVLALWALFVFQ